MFYGPRFPLTAAQRALYKVERRRRYWWPGLLKLPRIWAAPERRRDSMRLKDLRA